MTSKSCTPREDKGAKRINPHIGPLPIVIPLKLFLERITFPAEDISSRVAWKFRGGIKVQKHVGRAKVAMNAKQERIKRVYPLLVGNDNRFLRVFSLFEHISFSPYEHGETENGQKLSLK